MPSKQDRATKSPLRVTCVMHVMLSLVNHHCHETRDPVATRLLNRSPLPNLRYWTSDQRLRSYHYPAWTASIQQEHQTPWTWQHNSTLRYINEPPHLLALLHDFQNFPFQFCLVKKKKWLYHLRISLPFRYLQCSLHSWLGFRLWNPRDMSCSYVFEFECCTLDDDAWIQML